MPRFLNKKIFVLLLFSLFLFPSKASAAVCGSQSQQYVSGCGQNRTTLACEEATSTVSRTCYDNIPGHVGSCVAQQVTYYCNSSCTRTSGGSVYVACGSSGSGSGSGSNCNHSYSCAQSGSAAMSKCCSGTNCCGFINSGPNTGQPKKCRDNGCVPNPPACTAPTIFSVSRVSPTSLSVEWQPGAETTSQTVYVGANLTEVTNNCPGTSCVVKATGIAATTTTYTTANVLVPGTIYYVKVFSAGSCNLGSGISTHLSSCLISPTSVQVKTGLTQAITTSINSSTAISQVNYSSSNSSIASVSPTSDTTYVYGTTVTGNNQGSATITSSVYLGSNPISSCIATTAVTVTPGDPWWQVKDSDINSGGTIISAIPTAGVGFDLSGPGGFPGVVIYGGSFDLYAGTGTGTVSTTGWIANTSVASTKIYDSTYFARQIPSDVVFTNIGTNAPDGSFFETGGTLSHGFYWYRYDGSATGLDFTINSSMNLGDRRVILLVDDADLYIGGNITLNDGSGFFMTIAGKNGDGGKGNIFVSPTVGGGATPNLEGIYLADGVVRTGTNTTSNDIKIYFRGSVTGYDGVNLERDLGAATNSTTPSEFFEYAPDQIMLFPKEFGVRKINWKEVAP